MSVPGSVRPLSRRAMLRGAGAAIALPWLDAMTGPVRAGEAAAGTDAPVRLAALFVPNGVRQDQWTPATEGADFELSPTLMPLRAWRDKLFVATNLWNQGSKVGDGHYVKTSGFLTCTTITKSLGIDLNCNGKSLDQAAAESVRGRTPLPSLELGVDPVTTGVDTNVGYTRVYGSHIAWSGPTTPLARELNPHEVFRRLCRAAKPTSGDNDRQAMLLDRVLGDAKKLRSQLGVEDRSRLDDYLESMRSIESRLATIPEDGAAPWKPRADISAAQEPPTESPGDHAAHVRLMLDMIALAFQTDVTRVATFMFGNAVSNRSFAFLDGVTGGYHELSHHQNEEQKLREYQLINQWHVEQYAYLLDRLGAMTEGESTVLDNSMILYGSGLRDGNSHNPHNLPIVVAGSGGGRLAVGQHRVYSPDTPLSNLYLAMLQAFGCEANRFADSTGALPGALA
ncbi:MAG: DUF1552 domain-containing protein [Planctomycetales bacterium]|nr:DUF1552 domain-containing protein [Planctomycetales bacterium]